MNKHKILYLEVRDGITVEKAAAAFADLGMDLQKGIQDLKRWRKVQWKAEKKEVWKDWKRTCCLEVEGEAGRQEISVIESEVESSLLGEEVKAFIRGVLNIVAEAAEHLGIPGKLLISRKEAAYLLMCGSFLEDHKICRVVITQLCAGGIRDTVAGEILRRYGITIEMSGRIESGIDFLGAAVAAFFMQKYGCYDRGQMLCGRILGIGTGTDGSFSEEGVRGILLEPEQEEESLEEEDQVWVLETNVDDCTGEQLGYTIERLMKAGAKDANAMPIYMKKNRPAYMLQVICSEDAIEEMEGIIFQETTSIGLRKYKTLRRVLPRRFETIKTDWGEVRMKVCTYQKETYYYPEYEDIKTLSQKYQIPYYRMYQQAVEVAQHGI